MNLMNLRLIPNLLAVKEMLIREKCGQTAIIIPPPKQRYGVHKCLIGIWGTFYNLILMEQ